MTLRVAISGKQGSGKSTLSQELVENYGFERISFATKLKEIAMDLFGLSWDQVYGDKKERVLLQELGAKMREIDSEVWIKYVIRQVEQNRYTNYVIDDVRYKNEFEALKEAGFVMLRVECVEKVRKGRIGENYKNDTHMSETDLDFIEFPLPHNQEVYYSWDAFINNSSIPLKTFKQTAGKLVESYKSR
jgi:adenylate kinase family enzyme